MMYLALSSSLRSRAGRVTWIWLTTIFKDETSTIPVFDWTHIVALTSECFLQMFQHHGPPITGPEAQRGKHRVFVRWYFRYTMAKGQQGDWRNKIHSLPGPNHSKSLDSHKHPCDPLPLCLWQEPEPSNDWLLTEKHEVSLRYLFDFQWEKEYRFSLLHEDRCSDSCPWWKLHWKIWRMYDRECGEYGVWEWSEINVCLFGCKQNW